MAKVKRAQLAIWYCSQCNRGNYISDYDKRENENTVKVLRKHCGQCHKTLEHKRKDSKKAAK